MWVPDLVSLRTWSPKIAGPMLTSWGRVQPFWDLESRDAVS